MLDSRGGGLLPACHCDTGYVADTSGWLCLPVLDTGLCSYVTCSGRGKCVSEKGRGVCQCDTGYQLGPDGTTCLDPCSGVTCSGKGTCQRTSAGARCLCQVGSMASTDGKSCLPVHPGTHHTYKLLHDGYTDYKSGHLTLDLSELTSGKIKERMGYFLYLDSGGRGLRRMTLQTWILDATDQEVTLVEHEDHYTQASVTRKRRTHATFLKGKGTVSMRRSDQTAAFHLTYKGTRTPLPMPGAHEYPGWTLGCFSPVFYMMALARFDTTIGGTQYLEVFWPESGSVQRVKVQADSTSTSAKPVLFFPETEVKVTYTQGIPDTIQLVSVKMTWTRFSGTPMDLNLPTLSTAKVYTPAALPTDLSESKATFTSTDGTALTGTLTVPTGKTAPLPAVLLVSDALAEDREIPFGALAGVPLYRHLAAHLAHAGYASLRYDPRGCGESKGSLDTATLTLLAQDAAAALSALQASTGVDATRVYLMSLGYSSVVALSLLASKPQVKGIVLLSPVVQDVDKVALYGATAHLVASGFSTNYVDKQKQAVDKIIQEIIKGTYSETTYQDLPVALWKELFTFKGLSTLVAFSGPVLVVWGDQDLETPDTQLKAIQAEAVKVGKSNLTAKTLTDRTFALTSGKKTDIWESAFLPLDLPTDMRSTITAWLATH